MLSLGCSGKILTVSYSLIIYHKGSPDCNGVWISDLNGDVYNFISPFSNSQNSASPHFQIP